MKINVKNIKKPRRKHNLNTFSTRTHKSNINHSITKKPTRLPGIPPTQNPQKQTRHFSIIPSTTWGPPTQNYPLTNNALPIIPTKHLLPLKIPKTNNALAIIPAKHLLPLKIPKNKQHAARQSPQTTPSRPKSLNKQDADALLTQAN